MLILISLGLLLLNGCGKKPNHYQLTHYDKSKTVAPKKDGKLDGITKRYYGNGKLYQEISYIDGKRTGVHATYTIVGDLIDYETYKDDILNGLTKKYHYLRNDKTQLRSKLMYKNGKKNGLETTYNKNGKVSSKIVYVNGKKDGVAYFYDALGRKTAIISYQNGKKNGTSTVWRYPYRGELTKEVQEYKEGKREGQRIKYYSTGKVSSKVFYKNDELNGKAIYFYKNGKTSAIDNWKSGKLDGESIAYKKDGTMLYKFIYKTGEDVPSSILFPNDAIAQYNLGLDFRQRKRGGYNHNEMAVKLYTLASNQGLADAQNNLGGMYYHGRGTKVNKIKAYQVWNKASIQGSEEAQVNLDHLCKESPWACK